MAVNLQFSRTGKPLAMAEDKNPTNEPNPDIALEEALVEELDERDIEIARLREEAAQYKDRLLRTAADMDNLRKRAEREKAEATLYAATNFARDLLSVSDNMQRALDHKPAEDASQETKNLFTGIEMTQRELLNVFQRYNIRKVQTVGAKFDPNVHQALFEMPTKEYPPGTVVQEMQSGFAIGDRCLRPAMVGVAKAED